MLIALAGGDKHGWAILKDVERFSEGRIRLSAGSLYGLIARLAEQGLIEDSPERPPSQWDDERRRYYRITPHGRQTAIAEISRLERTAAVARDRNLTPEGSLS